MRIFSLRGLRSFFRPGEPVPAGSDSAGVGATTRPGRSRARPGAARRGERAAAALEAAADPDPRPSADAGLHGLARSTDLWFAAELSVLERHACDQAAAWAAAGLPRPDVADEALSIEIALEKRCAELFRRWAERVRNAVDDAVHDALGRAGNELIAFRSHLAELRRTLRETALAERELERVRSERPGGEVTFGFPRLLPPAWFWTMIVLLMIVDLVANIPIFHELVPHEANEELLWQELTARSERYGLWAGAYRVAARLLFAPDITLLALGVVAFLVFSAHVTGEALRQRIALREEDSPVARIGIRSHRRQWALPAVGGAVAAAMVITFLFVSRIIVAEAARDRYDDAVAQVTRLEGDLARARAAADLDAITEVETALPTARAVLADRERKLEYATGIAAMNRPILILNLVLALAAALASYLAKETRITDGRREDPGERAIVERIASLRVRARHERDAIRAAGERAAASLARAQRLLDARPLRGWEAKAERLRGVIPLFRAENARLRGVDPANIAAFRREPTTPFPTIDPEMPFPVPDDLPRRAAELERLEAELAALDVPAAEAGEREAA